MAVQNLTAFASGCGAVERQSLGGNLSFSCTSLGSGPDRSLVPQRGVARLISTTSALAPKALGPEARSVRERVVRRGGSSTAMNRPLRPAQSVRGRRLARAGEQGCSSDSATRRDGVPHRLRRSASRKRPAQFIMAIECDGASCHSAPMARDQDRQRPAATAGRWGGRSSDRVLSHTPPESQRPPEAPQFLLVRGLGHSAAPRI